MKEPPDELYASYQEQQTMIGARECLFVSASTDENGWQQHAQLGKQVRIGRYKLVEVKTLTLEPKFE